MENVNVYSRVELSNLLKEVLEEKIELTNLEEVIKCMLFYIGDEDPVLRDQLIYKAFYTLIVAREEIDEAQCKDLLVKLLSDRYLFYGIHQKDEVSVLTRSFSILVIALILHRHRLHAFLTKEEFQVAKQKVILYFKEEKDYRGYDEKVGWIHAIAHTADALEEIVLSVDINKNDCLEILDLASKVFTNATTIFTHEEDERFIAVLEVMRNRNFISQQELMDWSRQLDIMENYLDYKSFVQRINGKNLKRSMLIRELI